MSQDRPFHDPLSGFPSADPLAPPPLPGAQPQPGAPEPPTEPPPFRAGQRTPSYGSTEPGGTPPQHLGPEHERPEPMRATGMAAPKARQGSAHFHNRRRWTLIGVVVAVGGVLFGLVIALIVGGIGTGSKGTLAAEDLYEAEHWSATVNGNTAEADRVGAWDHEDCSDVGESEIEQILSDAGCEYGIEGAYEREDLGLVVFQRVFVLADEASAEAAAEQIESDELTGLVKFHQPVPVGEPLSKVGASQHFLVVTHGVIESADPSGDIDEEPLEMANRVLAYRHVETTNVLIWW